MEEVLEKICRCFLRNCWSNFWRNSWRSLSKKEIPQGILEKFLKQILTKALNVFFGIFSWKSFHVSSCRNFQQNRETVPSIQQVAPNFNLFKTKDQITVCFAFYFVKFLQVKIHLGVPSGNPGKFFKSCFPFCVIMYSIAFFF